VESEVDISTEFTNMKTKRGREKESQLSYGRGVQEGDKLLEQEEMSIRIKIIHEEEKEMKELQREARGRWRGEGRGGVGGEKEETKESN
jgi:hypothetical protein